MVIKYDNKHCINRKWVWSRMGGIRRFRMGGIHVSKEHYLLQAAFRRIGGCFSVCRKLPECTKQLG